MGDALKQAWDASRDARVGALESARHAMKQLGEAIDHGIAAARQKWEAEEGDGEEEGGVTPPTVDHLPEKDDSTEADED